MQKISNICFYSLLFLTCWIQVIPTCAQMQIDAIRFEGLKRTQKEYLLRFISTHPPSSLDSAALAFDVQQLKNLSILANVTYRIETQNDSNYVVFACEERITSLPIIGFGAIKENFWTELGFNDINAFGTGIEMIILYRYYDRHSLYLSYRTPYVNNSKWGYGIALKSWATIEPLYFQGQSVSYNYDIHSMELTGMYQASHNHRIEFTKGYFYENINKREGENQLLGPKRIDKNKILTKIHYTSRHINHHYFYLSGYAHSTQAEYIFTPEPAGNSGQRENFIKVINDFKYFKRIGKKGNFAIRISLGLSTNEATAFTPFVVDSHVNIRGSGNRVARGTAELLLNMEYRQTLFENHFGAIQGVVFSDNGTWRSAGGSFKELVQKASLRQYVGAGLRFIYKKTYDAVLRIDYGADVNGSSSGLVIGIGQYF